VNLHYTLIHHRFGASLGCESCPGLLGPSFHLWAAQLRPLAVARAALTYLGYKTTQTFLDEAITHLRNIGSVWLVWPHKTSLRPPEIENAKVVNRLEFYENDPNSEILQKLRKQLPPGFEICPINAQLFKRCEWREEMKFYAGGFDNFLKYGIGICIWSYLWVTRD
jgi:hypothetical protein